MRTIAEIETDLRTSQDHVRRLSLETQQVNPSVKSIYVAHLGTQRARVGELIQELAEARKLAPEPEIPVK